MSCTWIKRESYGAAPAARQGHAITLVGKSAYIFGGSSGSGYGEHVNGNTDPVYLNDLFHLKVGLQVTWERMRQLGDIPCGRDGHTLSSVGSVLYLLGGTNYPEADECLEGLYAYDVGTLSWEQCPVQGYQPRALGQSTAAIGDTLYVFGGIYRGEARNTLHMLNTGNLTWTTLKTSGHPPTPRCDHACTVIGEKFYIFGGSGGENIWFNDLYCFDSVTLVWYFINAQGHLPHPRSLHSLCAHHDKDIYMFGGANDSSSLKSRSPFGEVFKFSLSKMKWKKLHCEGTPPERRLGHTAVMVYGQMIVFGGMNDEKDYNDIAILQTRAAAKQLPPGMSDALDESTSSFQSVPGPQTSYDTNVPIPAPYETLMPSLNEPAKPPNFDTVKVTFIQRIEDIFEDLSSKYAELETQKSALQSSIDSFQEEREANIEQYHKQQKELEEMLQRHKQENEEWIRGKKEELDEEKAKLDQEKAKLAKEQQEFEEKRKKE
ncbi:rab9 effector protein with kelch motifs-like [Actinia tenebrosa]|uniref:Rab9 effector protein with kelch motifs-like n=1 Tax=Actinia tenebrosa TaxID=6105 RepID=A0A6P8J9M3_ACTTE|nr:rab9 effector protein with kelch motifs-like [Actinia tenebrosa]